MACAQNARKVHVTPCRACRKHRVAVSYPIQCRGGGGRSKGENTPGIERWIERTIRRETGSSAHLIAGLCKPSLPYTDTPDGSRPVWLGVTYSVTRSQTIAHKLALMSCQSIANRQTPRSQASRSCVPEPFAHRQPFCEQSRAHSECRPQAVWLDSVGRQGRQACIQTHASACRGSRERVMYDMNGHSGFGPCHPFVAPGPTTSPPVKQLSVFARLPHFIREDLSTGYGLRFSTEIYGSKREKTVVRKYLHEACFFVIHKSPPTIS